MVNKVKNILFVNKYFFLFVNKLLLSIDKYYKKSTKKIRIFNVGFGLVIFSIQPENTSNILS
ncbi:MAG: putative membrane protein [Flavobacterium sp.]|jgi:uncharacterized membrane protein